MDQSSTVASMVVCSRTLIRSLLTPPLYGRRPFSGLMWNNTVVEVRGDTGFELLLERAPDAQASRVLATVVRTAGSTYRKPGARMLLMADGSYIGLRGGGCLS